MSVSSDREHLLNVDFDLSLRPGWPRGVTDELRRQIAELSLHALLIAEPGESIILEHEPPEELIEHLLRNGIEPPGLTLRPAVRRQSCLAPYGWNEEAARINRDYDSPVEHPDLEVVRQVNGRSFGVALERELLGARDVLIEARCIEQLERAITMDLESGSGGEQNAGGHYVVKAEHGNAGLANRRLSARGSTASAVTGADRRVVLRMLDENDTVHLERWRPRCLDISVSFELNQQGQMTDLGAHEVINTADGAFIGALFEPRSALLERWRSALESAAQKVAGALHREGYFGPVCFDSFIWKGSSGEHLRTLVDLNARRHMSSGARALWRRWASKDVVYWRFFSRRKLVLPRTLEHAQQAMGKDAFDARARRGMLVTSPLELRDGRRPHKLGLLLVGSSRDEVLALERRFRDRFER